MKAPVAVAPSLSAEKVSLSIDVKSSGWDASVKIQTRVDITTEEARALASWLVHHAEKREAKDAAKAEKERKHQVWRDREVSAGRWGAP